MKPTEELAREHEDIRVMLRVVRVMSARLDRGEPVDPADLERAADFIRNFADRYHHAKEEDLLFPAMELAGFARDTGPLGVMLAEHDEGRGYVRAMVAAIERYKAGDTSAGPVVAANARNYTGLLEQHIEKENQALYPMADNALSEAQQRELRADFDKTNGEPAAVESHERLQAILRDLRDAYLGD